MESSTLLVPEVPGIRLYVGPECTIWFWAKRLRRVEVVLGYFALYLKTYRNAGSDVGILLALQGCLAIESLH